MGVLDCGNPAAALDERICFTGLSRCFGATGSSNEKLHQTGALLQKYHLGALALTDRKH